jgi:hypothetical protein
MLVLATMELVAHDMHAYEMHAYGMHAYEMHAHERHAHGMHAYEIHACERGTSWEALHKRYAPVRDACPRDACPPEMHAYERHRRACVRRFPTATANLPSSSQGCGRCGSAALPAGVVSIANFYCGSHLVANLLEDSRSFAVANYLSIYLRSTPDPFYEIEI